MKKIVAVLAFGTLLLFNTAFANIKDSGVIVSDKVATAFRHEFVAAKEASWLKGDNYYKVIFKLNDDILTAYFTNDGEMISVMRNLLSTELPIGLQTSLKKDYSAYWISNLFEYAKQGESGYYVTLENADVRVTLHSTDGRNWAPYQRFKKEL